MPMCFVRAPSGLSEACSCCTDLSGPPSSHILRFCHPLVAFPAWQLSYLASVQKQKPPPLESKKKLPSILHVDSHWHRRTRRCYLPRCAVLLGNKCPVLEIQYGGYLWTCHPEHGHRWRMVTFPTCRTYPSAHPHRDKWIYATRLHRAVRNIQSGHLMVHRHQQVLPSLALS